MSQLYGDPNYNIMKDLIIMKGENTIINSVNSDSSTEIAHYNKEEENLLKIDKNTPGQLQCHHHINEQKNGDDDYCEENEKEKLVCYICTEKIEIHAISQCNHRICHICCLRLRYLFKSYNCAYCRDNSCWHELSKLGIFCEDRTIYEKSMDLIIPKCPIDDCKFQCYSKNEDVDDVEANMEQENQDGVFELLYEHVREIHKLTYW
nr:2993_t:CDS:2 [Entrophospora candida]